MYYNEHLSELFQFERLNLTGQSLFVKASQTIFNAIPNKTNLSRITKNAF
jgi:hypothetical protein